MTRHTLPLSSYVDLGALAMLEATTNRAGHQHCFLLLDLFMALILCTPLELSESLWILYISLLVTALSASEQCHPLLLPILASKFQSKVSTSFNLSSICFPFFFPTHFIQPVSSPLKFLNPFLFCSTLLPSAH